jgi:hypothetical protein
VNIIKGIPVAFHRKNGKTRKAHIIEGFLIDFAREEYFFLFFVGKTQSIIKAD